MYAGAAIDDWIAPALTDENPSPVPWTQPEMFGYLRTGITALHGVTAGPMSPVVHARPLGRAGCRCSCPGCLFRRYRPCSRPKRHRLRCRQESAGSIASRQRARTMILTRGFMPAPASGAITTLGQAPLPARPELALNSALTLSEPNQSNPGRARGNRHQRRRTWSGDAKLRLGIHQRRHRAARGVFASHSHRPAALDRSGEQGCRRSVSRRCAPQ